MAAKGAAGGRTAVFLRGINVGTGNRIAMKDLARIVESVGATEVRTLLNSGNVVCTSPVAPATLAASVAAALREQAGLGVDVVARSAAEIDAVLALDPLGAIADNPSRYLVTFLEKEPGADAVAALEAADTGRDVWELHGRELYFWLPDGVADSAVQKLLMKKVLGVTWTGRNWATVQKVQAALRG
ncbi:MAG: DUF1697 domain-containing protein [Candidatus Nanopelagicales bacterium]